MQQRLDGERVLVIGLGKSGLASVAALRERGADVVATDEKERAALSAAIAAVEARGARFEPPDALAFDASLAVISPGIPPSSPLAQRVRASGVPVIGEVELAYRLSLAPMIAVTGTKGKSTTTALIAHLLRACGESAVAGGNLGEPLVSIAGHARPDSWVVAELSSFQLETIVTLRPRISVVLNILPDHLDRYASIEAYAEAKFRIFENQGAGDTIVLDRDDPRLLALEARFKRERCGADLLWYSAREPFAFIDRSDVPLRGEHNYRNAMAAVLAARAAGCDAARLREAVRSFDPLEHRLQPVAEADGVLYVDDSKATTPAAAVAALESFERPVVLIAGGREKGTDLGDLAASISRRAKALVAIGESAEKLRRLARGVHGETAASIEDAVERARRLAQPGDVVLLSPACASFDMFSSAEERGERFAQAARMIAEGARA